MTVQPLPDFGFLERTTASLLPGRNPLPINSLANAVLFGTYLDEAGLFRGMLYQTEPADPRGVSPGPDFVMLASSPSPAAEFTPRSGVVPYWHGAITPGLHGILPELGVVQLRDNFRMVAKISMSLRAAPPGGAKMFVGFIQDESPGGIAPSVGIAGTGFTDAATLFPSFSVVGFYLDTVLDTTWKMWTRGFGSADNFIGTPATATGAGVDGPFYFVIETNNQDIGNTSSAQVKLGVYDGDKNLLASTTVTDTALLPISTGGTNGLHFGVGSRENVAPGAGDPIYLHSVKLVLDMDEDDLPPLP